MRRFKFFTGLRWCQLRRWRRLPNKGPVCVSLSNAPKVRFPVVDFEVAIDGAGFSILKKYNEWPTTAEQHARTMRRVVRALGARWIAWCTIQDWMCEVFMLRKTGLSVREHQRRTVQSYLDLCRLAPEIPWLPVIQGWTLAEYLECVEMYRAAGVDLTEVERVGVGSVCTRQSTAEGVEIIVAMLRLGIQVHAFGYTASGLRALRKILTDEEWSRLNSDSAAWSKHAWKSRILMPGHYHGKVTTNCANCEEYGAEWSNDLRFSLEAA